MVERNIMKKNLLVFGEVLFDHFPDGSVVLGGAPFNVAWHLQAFGQSPLFISRVGDDPLGRRVKSAMLAWGMNTSGLQLDSAHPTGMVDVTFPEGEPQFDIVENSAYDFIAYDALPPLPDKALLYHGSLAMRNETSRTALRHLKQTTSFPCFVDINLRPPWWSEESIQQILHEARWIKLNEDELAQLVPQEDDMEKRIAYLLQQLALESLVITQGSAGATAFSTINGQQQVVPQKKTQVIDTVGAGDAFSSILLLGLAMDWSIERTLARAQDFASAIVGIRGATVNDRGFYQPFFDAWNINEL